MGMAMKGRGEGGQRYGAWGMVADPGRDLLVEVPCPSGGEAVPCDRVPDSRAGCYCDRIDGDDENNAEDTGTTTYLPRRVNFFWHSTQSQVICSSGGRWVFW